MSHWSKVKVAFKNTDTLRKALQEACEHFRLTFEEGNLTLNGYLRNVSGAQFAVRQGDLINHVGYTYGDLGLTWDAERGAYDLHLDNDTGKLDEFVDMLKQRYTYHNTLEWAASQGLEAIEETQADGGVRVVFKATRRAKRLAQRQRKQRERARVRVGR